MKNKKIKSLISKNKKYKKRIKKLEARLEEYEKSCCPPEVTTDTEAVEQAESETSQAESSSE